MDFWRRLPAEKSLADKKKKPHNFFKTSYGSRKRFGQLHKVIQGLTALWTLKKLHKEPTVQECDATGAQ